MDWPSKYAVWGGGVVTLLILLTLILPGRHFEIRPPLPANITVTPYFSPQNIGNDCSVVVPVARQVPYTAAVAQTTLEQLLLGPLGSEVGSVATNIPGNVIIKSFVLADGELTVDFSAELGEGVAGACRVTAVRSQIEKTSTQFPEIKTVVISIEGQTEGILQP